MLFCVVTLTDICYFATLVHGIVRSYHGESTRSHPNSEVKHHWACSVLRWGTTRESQVAYVLSSEGAIGLVVKYFVANEVPRVRFPDGAFLRLWGRSAWLAL